MNRKLSKLHLKFNIIVFLTIICIFGVAQYNHYTDLRSDYLNVVKRISQRLSGKFDFFYHNVQNISFNSSVKRLNPTNSVLYFDSLVALYPSYDLIILTDTSGRLVAANTIGSAGEALDWKRSDDFSQSKWFQSMSTSQKSEDFTKKLFGSLSLDVQESGTASSIYKRKKYGMHFSSAVRDRNEKVVGYLTTFVNDQWLSKLLHSASSEVLRDKESGFEAVLVNSKNEVLASNKALGLAPLSKLSFDVKTAQFSKLWGEGKILDGLKSLKVFFNNPFFIVSKFNHQNFINDFDWSLIVKFGKENALASIWKNLLLATVAMGLLFIVGFVYNVRIQTMLKLEVSKAWKSAEDSFSKTKQLKAATRALKSTYRALDGLRSSKLLTLEPEIPMPDLSDSNKLSRAQLNLEESIVKQGQTIKSLNFKKLDQRFNQAVSMLERSEAELRLLTKHLEKLDSVTLKLKEKSLKLDVKAKEFRVLDTLLEELRASRRDAQICSRALSKLIHSGSDNITEVWNSQFSILNDGKEQIVENLNQVEVHMESWNRYNEGRELSQTNWLNKWGDFMQSYAHSKESMEEFKAELLKTQASIEKLGIDLNFDKKDKKTSSKSLKNKKAA